MSELVPTKFNIRVYGIFFNEQNEILVTDEFQLDTKMTKFPGGGMHFGEGTLDCLKREMIEECNQEITELEHFYTTDFYQKALYFSDHQLLSIYYTGKLKSPLRFNISDKPFDFEKYENGNQSFRWIHISKIKPDIFTFPVDKHVANLLSKAF